MYDADTNVYSDVSISTNDVYGGGYYVFGADYTSAIGTATSLQTPWTYLRSYYSSFDISEKSFLSLTWDGALTNSGGTHNLVPGLQTVDQGTRGDNNFNYAHGTISASSAITPIPAAVWLFGSALAGLGWMSRKQTV